MGENAQELRWRTSLLSCTLFLFFFRFYITDGPDSTAAVVAAQMVSMDQ